MLDAAELLCLSRQLKSCVWLNFAKKPKICCGQAQKYLQSGKRTKAGLSTLCIWGAWHEKESCGVIFWRESRSRVSQRTW